MFAMFKTTAAWTALALLLTGPATARTHAPVPTSAQTPAADAAAPAPASAHPALWVLRDADTTIYLFGTIHILKPGIDWFDGRVRKAFDASSQLVLELPDIDDPRNQALVAKLAANASGTPFTAHMSANERAAYARTMAGFGLPAMAFDKYKPWFAAINLSLLPLLKLGYDPNSGVERALTAVAVKSAKRISGFETTAQQLGFFDSMPEPLQIKYLDETVKDVETAGPDLEKLVDQWSRGDADGLAETLNEGIGDQPELAKLLLEDRNKRWAAVLKDMLNRPGTFFVAVGAGHLAGKVSVQQQLKRLGLTTTRVAD